MNTTVMPDPEFWQDKRVLLTGHSGFKGAWLAIWLKRLGAKTTGISLPPLTQPALFQSAGIADICDSHFCDIRDASQLAALIASLEPQVVFHLAAQPLVRRSYVKPLETFDTNIMGSANLLETLRSAPNVRAVVMVTTDKVYRNKENTQPYGEEDELGGHDPYSASKAASELVIASYRDAFFQDMGVGVASARAGNVIGGGDWSDDRLIPDAVRAWQSGHVLDVRRPDAVRPWQHVLEPLCGYLVLCEHLWHDPKLSGVFNFGPPPGDAASVRTLVKLASASYKNGAVKFGKDVDGPHEAGLLALEVKKSAAVLGIEPRWPLDYTVEQTINWYQEFYDGGDARQLCEKQINFFESGLRDAST